MNLSSRKGSYTMAQELGLPGDRESGMKLIRRSIADLIRARLVAAGKPDDDCPCSSDFMSGKNGGRGKD